MGKVRPILFNTEMVRAVLDGKKSVTRRVIKFPKNKFTGKIPKPENVTIHYNTIRSDKVCFKEKPFYCLEVRPPYRTGDILYVRETWSEWTGGYLYKAWTGLYQSGTDSSEKWHPSIHMPKEAARIWLKVTKISAERLQDIDDNGIAAEGLEIGCDFENIWDSVIKKAEIERLGWEANPWVWVIEFERCEKPEKWLEEGWQ